MHCCSSEKEALLEKAEEKGDEEHVEAAGDGCAAMS
jgi:hypothetical protein